jgi:type I restriction enzyme S subunit
LDKADALREKRRQSLAQLDTLLQSVFLDMFGDPVTNPKGWDLIKLGELAEFVGGGTPRRDNPAYYTGEICWATSKDMKGEILLDTQEHITQEAIENSATKLVPAGTILIVVKSKILLRYLPVLISAVPTCFGQDLKGITLQKSLSTRYVARHLRIGQRALLEKARGVNTEGLTLEHLRNYQLLFPPMEMIEDYDRIEAQLIRTRNLQADELKKFDALFQSLQQRAFTGELFAAEARAAVQQELFGDGESRFP